MLVSRKDIHIIIILDNELMIANPIIDIYTTFLHKFHANITAQCHPHDTQQAEQRLPFPISINVCIRLCTSVCVCVDAETSSVAIKATDRQGEMRICARSFGGREEIIEIHSHARRKREM
jgi:hypothetical protein